MGEVRTSRVPDRLNCGAIRFVLLETMMTPAEYFFLLSQIFLARALTPFSALVFAVFLLILAILKGL